MVVNHIVRLIYGYGTRGGTARLPAGPVGGRHDRNPGERRTGPFGNGAILGGARRAGEAAVAPVVRKLQHDAARLGYHGPNGGSRCGGGGVFRTHKASTAGNYSAGLRTQRQRTLSGRILRAAPAHPGGALSR